VRLEARRGDIVVCVPVYGALDLARECLEAVRRHTNPDVTVLVADDATPGGVAAAVDGLDVEVMTQPRNVGFVENANAAMRTAAPADVVLLNSDVVVGEGWLDGLCAAAAADTRVATVSALADEATIASVDGAGRSTDDAARAVREGSLRLHPRLPTAIGHCVLIRRAAIELAGDFDPAFSPGYGEEVDFSQRCLARGMIHVLADDVWVRHRARGSFGDSTALRESHERELERRWPYYPHAVRRAMRSAPLADSLAAARRSLGALSVTIDGSALGPVTMGTQVTTVALARALAARDDVRLRVALPDAARLDGLDVELVTMSDVERGVEATDVVHRPYQAFAPKDLDRLHRLGRRAVITQQDLIAYANPAYFASFAAWDEQRTVARQSLAVADATVFISEVVRDDALARELVAPGRARVIAQGVDHALAVAESRAPAATPLGDAPFLLCIGADFHHKNHVFAIRMLRELRARGVDATLVLAGPQMQHGSSWAEEEREADGERVVRLRSISDAEKAWLYANAALVLYPTVSEGFGLVPFEAARAGTPCMFAPVSSLPEVVGAENATLVPWDAAASAERALRLLRDDGERRALVDAIAARGAEYTWERTADALVAVYRDVVAQPARAARGILFGEGLSDVALSLVGPGGQLPPDVQRALQALATRPALRRPTFAALEASYRALRRVRRARGRE
jgi:glycosyltransferase involved in cell wall biosynthesis